jgi:hypothetical protein
VSLMEEGNASGCQMLLAARLTVITSNFCGAIPYPFIRRFVESTRAERFDQTIDAAMPWLFQFAMEVCICATSSSGSARLWTMRQSKLTKLKPCERYAITC